VSTGATSLLDQAKEGKMRRVMLVLAAMALMVSLFAVVAYAANITGTDEGETLLESDADDQISGLQGDDKIFASVYGDDEDTVEGNRQDDKITVADGDNKDVVIGGDGYDTCWGDEGDDIDCEKVNGAPQPPF
jgi:Ca2+-binding RTX toxin-like protein